MSDKVINTDKVDNIIGLRDQLVYDKIDIYVDVSNNENLWAMVFYTEYINHKPIQKYELKKFINSQDMINFVKTNFNGYELNHPVDINQKHVFFHYLDYCDLQYFSHNGKNKLDYIEITFRENENGLFVKKSMRFPKEKEEFFKIIYKISKKIPYGTPLGPRYHKDIDVYSERANNRREIVKNITTSVEEVYLESKDRIKTLRKNKTLIEKLKVFVTLASLGTILGGGYNLVTHNLYNSNFLVQTNPVKNVKDIKTFFQTGDTGIIIDKLMHNEYEGLTLEEINKAIDFISRIDNSNYDSNDSFNEFNFSGYFKYFNGTMDKNIDLEISNKILEKIESLYNNCFYIDNGKVILNEKNTKSYIDYVASLTFMYDTYHQTRPFSTIDSIDTSASQYASKVEIETFDMYNPMLKYIIANQLRGVLSRSNYKIDKEPSYYFHDKDKYSLLSDLKNKMDSYVDEMYFQYGYNQGNKSM